MTKAFLTLALLGAVAWLWKALRLPETPLRNVPKLTPIGIYCGDCANPRREGRLVRTFLTTDGRCNGCGGRSYVLASLYAPLVASRTRREFAVTQGLDQVYSDSQPESREEAYDSRD